MSKDSKEQIRQFKKDSGEVVEMSEEEFQQIVDVFKILSNWDKELFLEAYNGAKLKLRILRPEDAKKAVGKDIFVSILVKEEIQTKAFDFYYKLEKVKLLGAAKKGSELRIEGIDGKPIAIENRRVFFES